MINKRLAEDQELDYESMRAIDLGHLFRTALIAAMKEAKPLGDSEDDDLKRRKRVARLGVAQFKLEEILQVLWNFSPDPFKNGYALIAGCSCPNVTGQMKLSLHSKRSDLFSPECQYHKALHTKYKYREKCSQDSNDWNAFKAKTKYQKIALVMKGEV